MVWLDAKFSAGRTTMKRGILALIYLLPAVAWISLADVSLV